METFGIELEVSDLGIQEAQRLIFRAGLNWQVKSDGTHHVSAEAVSPILTADSLNEVKKATRVLQAGGATVNRQTGYHVHVGADEYGLSGIAGLVFNWYRAHNTIGTLVAKSRLNNKFCTGTIPNESLDLWVQNIVQGNINNRPVAHLNPYASRYFSLNLESYRRHQTLEVRLHHGTLNGSKVKAWAEFVSAMARFSTAGHRLAEPKWADADADARLNNISELLTILSNGDYLATETATYLLGRAEELSNR